MVFGIRTALTLVLTLFLNVAALYLVTASPAYAEKSNASDIKVIQGLLDARLSGRNGWIGVIETYNTTTSNRTSLDKKFDFPSSRIATSFNNIASIHWPEEVAG